MNIGKKHLNEEDFSILWGSVEHELYKLFYNNKCSALVVYNNIYIICTAPQSKFVEALYWKIGDFIYARAKEMRVAIYKAEDWIPEYNAGFGKFKYYVACLNELCDFLSQYISAKSLDVFAFILWERCILQTAVKYKGTPLGQALVKNSKVEVIREAIESFKCIVLDSKNPLLYYVQNYEQYALERIKHEQEMASTFMGTLEISDYAKYVYDTVMKHKQARDKLFLEESFEKLDLILEDILVSQRKKFIQTEVFRLLNTHKLPVEILDTIRDSGSRSADKNIPGRVPSSHPVHPINDFYALYNRQTPGKTFTLSSEVLGKVSRVFKFLKVIRHSYEIMRNSLVKFISTQLETHFHLLDRRIETLYVFYCMFKNVVEVGFDSDPGCFQIFEEKFSEVLNRLKPSLTSRLIDFSSSIVSNDNHVFEFLDSPGRLNFYKEKAISFYTNKNRSLPEIRNRTPLDDSSEENSLKEFVLDLDGLTYRDGALLRVFSHLYNLIEDKNDFSERYIYELSRRLVSRTTDFQKEQQLMHIIKSGSTCDSIRKSEIMLSDMKASFFKGSTLLLTQCAWPLEYTQLNLNLPQFFSDLVLQQTKEMPKKKLSWLWEYSTVYIELNNTEVRVNMLQYVVLDLFNSHDVLSKEEISRRTNLTGNNLEWVLLSLYRSDILSLNKDDLISLSTRPHKHNPYDYFIKENLLNDHEINKAIYYQSAISKILKKSRELPFSDLYKELTLAHTERFPLEKDELFKAIKGLLEKGLIEEVPLSDTEKERKGKVFRYVP